MKIAFAAKRTVRSAGTDQHNGSVSYIVNAASVVTVRQDMKVREVELLEPLWFTVIVILKDREALVLLNWQRQQSINRTV